MTAQTVDAAAQAQVGQLKIIEKRWSKPLAKAGWTALPNIILDKQKVLGLEPIDVNILMQIAKHWWQAESAPFPSIETIASAIDVTPRTIQRRIAKMEKAKLIERNVRRYARGGQKSNAYTFKGLIERCTPFAEEAIAERERRKSGDRARVRRTQPLALVKK
jgi:DNA-binding transcriptional regulator YhcF (GntR family)